MPKEGTGYKENRQGTALRVIGFKGQAEEGNPMKETEWGQASGTERGILGESSPWCPV